MASDSLDACAGKSAERDEALDERARARASCIASYRLPGRAASMAASCARSTTS